MEKLHSSREFLVGDCLLASAFLSYTGAFSFDFRANMLNSTWEPGGQNKIIEKNQPNKDYKIRYRLYVENMLNSMREPGTPRCIVIV